MPKNKKRGVLFHIIDITLNIVIIVAIVAIIRTFVVSPFKIEGSSMTATLENNEYIVINKFRYLFQNPSRGDIVVFRPPSEVGKYYVKRVIGLPGDTIIIRDGNVYLREKDKGDVKLDEPYLNAINSGHTYKFPINMNDTSAETFTVPEGQYFVLGDNRGGSLDSRSFAHIDSNQTAYIPRKNIKGSVWFVALPIPKIHAIEPPTYNL